MNAIYGKVELENGLILNFLRFATDATEAIRIVTAQHIHVVRCWAVDECEITNKEQKNSVEISSLILE